MAKPTLMGIIPGQRVRQKLLHIGILSKRSPEEWHQKKTERNASCVSHTPVELHKKWFDDPDRGPVLQWKESGTRPFGPDICTASAATRYYWNSWDMLQI